MSMRNLYGIPLLIRTAATHAVTYDPQLTYLADLEFSHRIAQGGAVSHVPRVLIANRYHGSNSTRNLHRLLLQQMLILHRKLGLQMTRRDRLAMHINAYSVAAQKALFFRYLRGREAVRRVVAIAG